MLYSALSDSELQRWVRCSPQDHLAKIELLSRSTSIIEGDAARIIELEDHLEMLEDRCKEYDAIMRGYADV